MKSLIILACAIALPGIAAAADHGPVFSYATPVNSERELSFDTGIFGRSGSLGTQLSTGSGFGYGLTPQITINAFLPARADPRANGPLKRVAFSNREGHSTTLCALTYST